VLKPQFMQSVNKDLLSLISDFQLAAYSPTDCYLRADYP